MSPVDPTKGECWQGVASRAIAFDFVLARHMLYIQSIAAVSLVFPRNV